MLIPSLRKTEPPIVADAKRDDYGIYLAVRHRRNRAKLQPKQYAVILCAAADQLETWAEQMRDEAETIAMP